MAKGAIETSFLSRLWGGQLITGATNTTLEFLSRLWGGQLPTPERLGAA